MPPLIIMLIAIAGTLLSDQFKRSSNQSLIPVPVRQADQPYRKNFRLGLN